MQRLLSLDDRPTAVFAASDVVAIGGSGSWRVQVSPVSHDHSGRPPDMGSAMSTTW